MVEVNAVAVCDLLFAAQKMNEFSNHLFKREAMRPTLRTWIKHALFFLITFVTCTIAGVLPPFGIVPLFPDLIDPQNWTEVFQVIASLPSHYVNQIIYTIYLLFTNAEVLSYGLKFSVSLLTILTAHEFGHYIACRLYGVDATLPYFIPTPPLLGPAGTFGAFIKIVSPMPSRKAVFDIGVAGPIAGFIALIPVAILGFLTMETVAPEKLDGMSDFGIYFSDPLFFKILAPIFGINLNFPIIANPFYFAAWVGLLVTALNLFPSGQLDGGHALYAVFGSRIHLWAGRIVFVAAAILAISGWFLYNSPSGFLFAILLGVMMRVGHPEPYDTTPLDFKRKIIALLTLLIFVLCFAPFPIQVK
jgi:membrane-associated protease RseP (regulator of RpoE activity)